MSWCRFYRRRSQNWRKSPCSIGRIRQDRSSRLCHRRSTCSTWRRSAPNVSGRYVAIRRELPPDRMRDMIHLEVTVRQRGACSEISIGARQVTACRQIYIGVNDDTRTGVRRQSQITMGNHVWYCVRCIASIQTCFYIKINRSFCRSCMRATGISRNMI
jgi:hypothetical protein